MNNFSVAEVIKFVKENDVKFIRLAFCDIFGELKNVSIMPSELPKAFDTGIPFDASSIKGFMSIEESDLFLIPDPSTMAILPWRPSEGGVIRFFCNIQLPNGQPFHGDGRQLLQQAVTYAAEKDFTIKVGTECEFYLFELDEKGKPTLTPHDQAGYCDIAPLDRGENVRREICLSLEEMGIMPEMSHHEQGEGQNEIDFRYNEAVKAADNLVTFKSVVKNIAYRNGLHASFMPKPMLNSSGSGLHINVSISKNNKNIFNLTNKQMKGPSANFVAGVLNRIEDTTAFTNPLTNSYSRFGEYRAPNYITWSYENRSQLIRIPAAEGEFKRMELRNADPACSTYFALALIIYAGIEGVEKELQLHNPVNINLYTADKNSTKEFKKLPQNLNEALHKAKNSAFVQSIIPKDTLDKYIKEKSKEWETYIKADYKHETEIKMYFNRY